MPLLIVGHAGTYSIGQCDDISQLNSICSKYGMWLHLEGVHLSTLVLFSVPTEIQPVTSGDSITLNLPSWISVPSLSHIVKYLYIFIYMHVGRPRGEYLVLSTKF